MAVRAIALVAPRVTALSGWSVDGRPVALGPLARPLAWRAFAGVFDVAPVPRRLLGRRPRLDRAATRLRVALGGVGPRTAVPGLALAPASGADGGATDGANHEREPEADHGCHEDAWLDVAGRPNRDGQDGQQRQVPQRERTAGDGAIAGRLGAALACDQRASHREHHDREQAVRNAQEPLGRPEQRDAAAAGRQRDELPFEEEQPDQRPHARRHGAPGDGEIDGGPGEDGADPRGALQCDDIHDEHEVRQQERRDERPRAGGCADPDRAAVDRREAAKLREPALFRLGATGRGTRRGAALDAATADATCGCRALTGWWRLAGRRRLTRRRSAPAGFWATTRNASLLGCATGFRFPRSLAWRPLRWSFARRRSLAGGPSRWLLARWRASPWRSLRRLFARWRSLARWALWRLFARRWALTARSLRRLFAGWALRWLLAWRRPLTARSLRWLLTRWLLTRRPLRRLLSRWLLTRRPLRWLLSRRRTLTPRPLRRLLTRWGSLTPRSLRWLLTRWGPLTPRPLWRLLSRRRTLPVRPLRRLFAGRSLRRLFTGWTLWRLIAGRRRFPLRALRRLLTGWWPLP